MASVWQEIHMQVDQTDNLGTKSGSLYESSNTGIESRHVNKLHVSWF